MNQEIKFRARYNDKFSCYIKVEHGQFWWSLNNKSWTQYNGTPVFTDLDRYLGYKDKHGKEIYEGDKAKVLDIYRTAYVEDIDVLYGVCLRLCDDEVSEEGEAMGLAFSDFKDNLEVIGNINIKDLHT